MSTDDVTLTADRVDHLDDGAVLSGSLSYCHKCTQGGNDVVRESSWRDDRDAGAVDVTFYDGGGVIEVRDVKADAVGIRRASGLRGALRTEVHPGYRVEDAKDRQETSRRGKVTVFSAKARRRLLIMLGKVDAGASSLFLTLTVSDAVAHDGRSMKAYMRRFKARVARRFPAASMLWRLECVDRKSGAFCGQPVGHFHGLLWGVPDQPGLREWVADAWSACVGDRSRTSVEVPRSRKQVMAYAAKMYAAKPGDDGSIIPDVGRYWGVFQDDQIPWAVPLVRRLTYSESVKLLRVFRKWIIAGRRSRGRRGKVPYLTRWRAFFVDDPAYWADRLGGIVGDQADPVVLLSGIGRAVAVKVV